MIRLHVVVEGQTEETFVRDVLAPELASHSIMAAAHQVTTRRDRNRLYRGGLLEYAHLRNIVLWTKQDRNPDACFTTMIDLYKIPNDFPGFEESRVKRDSVARALWRFLPYIQVHEFEALLFSDPSAFSAAFPHATTEIGEIHRIAKSAQSPEYIDEGASTSPAKRITALLPGFAKSVHGPLIAAVIGLSKLRKACAHFDEWYRNIVKMSVDFPPAATRAT